MDIEDGQGGGIARPAHTATWDGARAEGTEEADARQHVRRETGVEGCRKLSTVNVTNTQQH
jgi:hypothetical protein